MEFFDGQSQRRAMDSPVISGEWIERHSSREGARAAYTGMSMKVYFKE